MTSTKEEAFLIKCFEERPRSFVGLVGVLSNKTAKTLKGAVLVGSSLHISMKNVLVSCWHSLVNHGAILPRFIPTPMKRCGDSRDSRQVRQQSSPYWSTGPNEVELEKTSTQIGPWIVHK